MTEENKTENKRRRVKMGKTLKVSVYRDTNDTVDSSLFTKDTLTGLEKVTERNGIYFLLFSDYLKAKDALIKLKKETNYFVVFNHYRIFIKCSQLVEQTPSEDFKHKVFKDAIRKLVQEKTNGHVIYPPRLYINRETGVYTGCGDITVDTKESEEALLDKDGELKFSKIGEKGELEVAFYRYRMNRVDSVKSDNHENI